MEEYYEVRDMFVPFNLPISMDNIDPEKILKYTKSDKKMVGGKVKFTLLKRIGEAYSDLSLTDEDLLEAIHYVLSE